MDTIGGGSHEALVADPKVGVAYAATPHALHDQHTRLPSRPAQAVLCEKPMTVDSTSWGLVHLYGVGPWPR